MPVRTGTGKVVNVARPEAGSSAIFFGGGGIGACAIMGAKLSSCGIIVAVDPATPKHEALRHFGATHVITPDQVGDAIHDLTDGRGFDYFFENVGRPEALRAAWAATRIAGTAVITGLSGTKGRWNPTSTSCPCTASVYWGTWAKPAFPSGIRSASASCTCPGT